MKNDNEIEKYGQCLNYVRQSSCPSELKITDVKFTKVDLPPWGCYLIRIDTNQGISGYGEMRDGASVTYLKYLKSRIVGEIPVRRTGFSGKSNSSAVSPASLRVSVPLSWLCGIWQGRLMGFRSISFWEGGSGIGFGCMRIPILSLDGLPVF